MDTHNILDTHMGRVYEYIPIEDNWFIALLNQIKRIISYSLQLYTLSG